MSRIVIYDSGVGGLSIYQEVVKQCPEHEYVFVSDNQAFPYGTKAEADLIERVCQVTEKIAQMQTPDILVVACNTASTVVLPTLRARYDFAVVGVVPAIKPAAQITRTQHIGLLATPATIQRQYTQELIQQFAQHCKISNVGSSELVNLAENKLYGRAVCNAQIEEVLAPLVQAQELDVLVLACTHFPLLAQEISQVFKRHNREVTLIDSSAAIAKRVRDLSQAMPQAKVTNQESKAVLTKAIHEPEFHAMLESLGFANISSWVV